MSITSILYIKNYNCYYKLDAEIDSFTKESINLWLLKSALQTEKMEYAKAYSYNDLVIEIDKIVSEHFKELRKEEEEYYLTLDKLSELGAILDELEENEKVEVIRRGKVRRAKLFYLRQRVGKAAKVKEQIKK